MLDYVIFGNELTHWLLAALFPLGGIIIAKIFILIFAAIGKRTGGLTEKIIGALNSPILWAGFVIGFRFAIATLAFSASIQTTLSAAVSFIIVLLLTWCLSKAYHVMHIHVLTPYVEREDTGIDLTLLNVLGIVAKGLIWILGIGSALSSAGFNVSAVLAGLGIGGVAIALASKDIVANIFGGVVVLTQRPFKIGHRIKVAGEDGWVQEVGLRSTRLRTWLGREILLPNKVFVESKVENVNAETCYFFELRPLLAFGTSPEKIQLAMDILQQIVDDCDATSNKTWLGLGSIKNGLPEIELWYSVDYWIKEDADTWPSEYDKKLGAISYINMQVLKRFADNGIELGMPTEQRINQQVGQPPAGL
jgi:MscS family membrane protein